jgi:hypothetical protein
MTIEQKQSVSIVQANVTASRLTGRRLMVARVVWAFIALFALGLLIPTYALQPAYLHTLCTGTALSCRNTLQVTPGDLRSFQALGLSLDFFVAYNLSIAVVIAVVYVSIGTAIFWRKSDDRMAFFASVTLLTFPAAFSYRLLAILPEVLAVPSHVLVFLGNTSLFLFFYLFPSGRFVPRWTRWLGVAVIIYWALDFFPPLPPSISQFEGAVTLGFFFSILAVQIYRYRRVSSAEQRRQTRWVVFGISIGLGTFLAVNIVLPFIPWLTSQVMLYDTISDTASGFLILIPLSIGIAILRSRLFDIDLLINRTLVYGMLTVSVVAIYILVVGGLGALLQTQGNLLVSLVATGLIAVVFQPLRTRLQRGVNRLMYGERDDPYGLISRLGARLEATLVPYAIYRRDGCPGIEAAVCRD